MEKKHDSNFDTKEKERLAGHFAKSDNQAPHTNELADGGIRNEMAEEQLNNHKTD